MTKFAVSLDGCATAHRHLADMRFNLTRECFAFVLDLDEHCIDGGEYIPKPVMCIRHKSGTQHELNISIV